MKKLSFILLMILLSSCATMRYGNFSHISLNKNIYLANDAVSQLITIYSPESTIFCINQNVHDHFGAHLIQAMRKKGYGVLEQNCSKQKVRFSYVIDKTKAEQLYRVSLYVNQETFSRMYEENNETFTPISPWSHKE